ncbi:MAG TPA: hypothetical protein VF830_01940, partial [Gemmatimonadales bacterium]
MSRAKPPSSFSDAVFLGLIGALAALGALVWAWGGVAGAVFGHGWPRLGAGQLPMVIFRLPARLADPAQAWPRGARRLLPSPVGAYAALALVAGIVWAAILATARSGVATRLLGGPPRGARWAANGDLRRLRSARPRSHGAAGRLTLGRYRGRLLRAEERHALVAFGPPQS